MNIIAFLVCSGIFIASYAAYGPTWFLAVYAICALVNVPAMVIRIREWATPTNTKEN